MRLLAVHSQQCMHRSCRARAPAPAARCSCWLSQVVSDSLAHLAACRIHPSCGVVQARTPWGMHAGTRGHAQLRTHTSSATTLLARRCRSCAPICEAHSLLAPLWEVACGCSRFNAGEHVACSTATFLVPCAARQCSQPSPRIATFTCRRPSARMHCSLRPSSHFRGHAALLCEPVNRRWPRCRCREAGTAHQQARPATRCSLAAAARPRAHLPRAAAPGAGRGHYAHWRNAAAAAAQK